MQSLYNFAMETRDYSKIKKLEKLTDVETFWDDVRRLTKNVKSEHAIRRWEILANARYRMLAKE